MVFLTIFHKLTEFWSFELFASSDIIHPNEHAKHANCGLHINFCNLWLILFYFLMKKDDYK